ncbi:MAG: hypothetical protein JKY52_16390 [Flavobacteriales bacterium]|nr:hypothetical protein [Flavobacteriales bacterium]
MEIETKRRIARGLNLAIVVIFSSCVALTSMAGYLDIRIALLSIAILTTSAFLMFHFYKKEKLKLGSIFFGLNLSGLIIIPIVRIVGTSFREGYIETLVITIPLVLLIVWNEKILKEN